MFERKVVYSEESKLMDGELKGMGDISPHKNR